MYICAVCNSAQGEDPKRPFPSLLRSQSNYCPQGHLMTRDSVIPGVVLGILCGLITGVFAGVPGLRFLASPSILLVEGFAVACLIRGMEKPQPSRRLIRVPAAMALTLPFICLTVSSILGRIGGARP